MDLDLIRQATRQYFRQSRFVSAACLLLALAGTGTGCATEVIEIQPAATQWESIGPGGGGSLQELAVHPQNPDCVIISCDMGTVWRTLDGGEHYESLNAHIARAGNRHHGSIFVRDWAWSSSTPPVLYGCDWGVLRSTDAGNTWSYAAFEGNRRARRIAVDPSDPDRIIVGLIALGGGRTTLMLSENGGRNMVECGRLIGGGWIEAPVEGLAFDPAKPARVLANTHAGLFVSNDGGKTWAKSLDGFGCGEIETGQKFGTTAFVTSMIRGDRTGSRSAGIVFRSTDGGESWINITGGLDRFGDRRQGDPKPVYYAVHPTNADIIYAGSGLRAPKGLFVTRDGGRQWDKIRVKDIQIRGYLYDPPLNWPFWSNDIDLCASNPEIVYWGDNALFRSSDGLERETQGIYTDEIARGRFSGRGLEPTGSSIVAFHPANEDIVYAGWIDLGFLTSIDGGRSWSAQKSEQIGHSFAPVIDPERPERMWLTAYGGGSEPSPVHVLQSENGGGTWDDLNRYGLPVVSAQKAVRQYLLLEPESPVDQRTLYLGLQSHQNYGSDRQQEEIGFYVFENGRWEKRNMGLPVNAPHLGALAYAGPGQVWVGVNSFQQSDEGPFVCFTQDAGETWRTHLVRDAIRGYATSIAVDPSDPARVYAAFSRNTYMFRQKGPGAGGLIRTTDGGRSWENVFGPGSVEGVAIHPENPSIIVLGVRSLWNQPGEDMLPGLYVSRDGGDHWERIPSDTPDDEYRWMGFSPHPPHALYVSTFGGGLFRGIVN
jgi:photosystem II stability/assembly factor-like uncharacterized protein